MTEEALVVGGGIVGICCGLALAEVGLRVRLIDRGDPAPGASRINAGVLATSSLVPLNAPGILRRAPGLLLGRSPGFRLSPRALRQAVPWGVRFLAAAREPAHGETVRALHALISLSMVEHRRRLGEAKRTELLSEAGWLFLYETEAAFAAGAGLRAIFERHGVAHESLDAEGLGEIEPHLARRFARALWLTGSASVRDPALVLDAYRERLCGLGARMERAEVAALDRSGARPAAILAGGERLDTDHLVVAAGAWSAALLRTAGLRLPMMSERGYARRFALAGGGLNRPVYDVAGGLVLAPRPEGVQLSTGTELTEPHRPGLDRQREPAARRAARLLPLGPPIPGCDAEADRPTLPDSRPAIGRLRDGPSVWLCCGHQHIGFSAAPGSAQLLAALLRDDAPPIDSRPFAPGRFGL